MILKKSLSTELEKTKSQKGNFFFFFLGGGGGGGVGPFFGG